MQTIEYLELLDMLQARIERLSHYINQLESVRQTVGNQREINRLRQEIAVANKQVQVAKGEETEI